ncbi:FkbM family methyltransferase [uncultured Erythrobacter sp.]|uniref:FkbM family methyltransferase n=1 Tax=uncultured Erythrobacter sp. TaxID=263913 RepID=UPI002604A608|nr:FkbM family methyltransferase [uncultured Erythrobacter sp.]
MTEAFDPFWKAAAAHVRDAGYKPAHVLAPAGFHALLPGCWSADNAPNFARLGAVIIHKGRIEEVPGEHLLSATRFFTPTFANEVFVIYSHSGEPVAPDNPHLLDRDKMISDALLAAWRRPARHPRTSRAPSTYVGDGRVLLETAFGHLMLVNGADTAIAPHLIRDGYYDRNLTDVIGDLLEPGMTFIDIGANFGTYSLIGAACVGDAGRVIAVEPAPEIAALLFENIVMNGFEGRTEIVRCALGEAEGTLTLYEFATRQGSNTMLAGVAEAARSDYGETISTREVECRTLDRTVADLALDRVDLVKIDVEGFEHQVLAGARQTLSQYRPKLILEWHTDFFDGNPEKAQALRNLLTEELGYRLKRIEPDARAHEVSLDRLMEHGHSDVLAEPV